MKDQNTVIIVGCVVSVVVIIAIIMLVISFKRSCVNKAKPPSAACTEQQPQQQQPSNVCSTQSVTVTRSGVIENPNQSELFAVPYPILPESFDFNSPDVKVMDDHVLVRSLSFLGQTKKEEYMKQASFNPNY